MSPYWLFLIVPAAFFLGMVVVVLGVAYSFAKIFRR